MDDRADLGDWPTIERHYDALDRESLVSAEGFVRWLEHWDELGAAVGEEGARRYIEMTLATDDPARERAHLDFLEKIQPQIKPREQALKGRFLRARDEGHVDSGTYGLLARNLAAEAELYRDANVPLQTEEAKLATEYQKAVGSQTVTFDGKERTLAQLGPVLEETDRSRRERAWRMAADRRLEDRERFEDLFDRLLELRSRIARNAGLQDYRTYAFKENLRFEYSPAECEAFHRAVERYVVPLSRELIRARRRTLGIESVRPWDTAVDPKGREPLKPAAGGEELAEGCSEVFRRLDPALGERYELMRSLGLLNLANYKGKAPGGYQATLPERRLPFIFMNAVGVDNDLRTLLHESGHAFHTFAARDLPVAAYRHAPLEFCEVASMAMELFALPHLEVFYFRSEERARAVRERLEGIIAILPWIATIDAFQHWLYTHPGHSRDERRRAWLETHERFGGGVDWTGLEDPRGWLWHRQLHLFLHPFYYIEYGIAQLGALGLWGRAREDPAAALGDYKSALALGGSRPLPELFKAAGLPFDFGEEAVGPLASALQEGVRD